MDFYANNCEVIKNVEIIKNKWKLPILWCLHASHSYIHYNKLKKEITGITNIMLTKSLRELESDGLIYRQEKNNVKIRSVDYGLSPRGIKFMNRLNHLKF
ncbi:winged helix-turn-helix transcriptional regulator [Leuconostoc suionicum]|uniref:winged helix-turn-helix transcriptional regulator n=1 Tax=Leuconostoc suionicum TaxID=1511761 RepID=UPI0024AE3EBB|nr:helix-turn-helix domain-containing protein [Leuconostoc suionicum]MDI6523809.1 helix-turn-helix domain-containing protein [Leuconostoc suionicum]